MSYRVRDLTNHFLNKFLYQFISQSEFNQLFSLLQSTISFFTYTCNIVISCFILPGTRIQNTLNILAALIFMVPLSGSSEWFL